MLIKGKYGKPSRHADTSHVAEAGHISERSERHML